MLSRAELKTLQKHRDYPSVTILLPTHRAAPKNKQDRIRAEGLVKQTIERLHREFSKRDVSALVRNLQGLVRRVDWEHARDGLALFAAKDHASAVMLPFRVRPRAVIDESFATRDLVFTLNRAPRYRVLVLGEKPTRLFEAATSVLSEHTVEPFPMTHTGPGGRGRLPGGFGINRSAVRDEAHRAFFRTVDDAVSRLQQSERLPLVVVGVDRFLAFYREVTRDPEAIAGLVSGSHAQTPSATLGKLVWPVLQAGATLDRAQALAQLDEAVAAQRYAAGIEQVWRAAYERRCRILLVDTEFEYPADLSAEGDRLLPYTGRSASSLDDAVDEVIESVLDAGGEVRFYDAGTLDAYQGIAAVLRY